LRINTALLSIGMRTFCQSRTHAARAEGQEKPFVEKANRLNGVAGFLEQV
jgi:hypothetical protein